MKNQFLFILILFWLSANAENEKSKLVVAIVVDQMRYDFLENLDQNFSENGFKKLIKGGYNFKNNHFNYVPTVTAPGHASVATGSTPSTHGIVGNDWYDRKEKREIYCTTDNNYENIGGNAYYGKKSPKNMKVKSFADLIKSSNDNKSKTISISLKDRGAIFMGGHSADAAYWFYGYDKGDMITSSYYMSSLPIWVDDFNKNIGNVYLKDWNLLLKPEKYVGYESDNNNYEKYFKGKPNTSFPYESSKLSSLNNGYNMIKETPYGNSLVTDFAIEAIINENLGDDDYVDVITIGYSSTDYIGHNFGILSLETQDTYYRLDLEIEKLLTFLDNKIGEKNYTLFLTGDHGALEVPAKLRDEGVQADAISKSKFKRSVIESLHESFDSNNLILSAMNNQIYINKEEVNEKGLNFRDVQNKTISILKEFDFVKEAYYSDFFSSENPYSGYEELIKNGFDKDRCGDVIFILKPNTIFYEDRGTTHGSGYDYDTHVPLIFYGANINHGESDEKTFINDITPTILSLLRVDRFDHNSGRSLFSGF
jgi:predicted AlkP superfamily pyrophosphatase or phosphodiesterase